MGISRSAEEGSRRLKAAQGGDVVAFAKLLTWLESVPAKEALSIKELLKPRTSAFRLGITGPPGAGKSTLVGHLIKELRAANLRVGVIAVDPSSPFTRGAILGDRIRYMEHSVDEGVFVRSLGTRGSLGGLSSSAFLMARAFDACGFDVLLIETVGVGQTELDILHVADKVCVVLVPESGDSIQAMKAGLMEIADIFVVNKSDRPGADNLVREIEASFVDGGAHSTAKEIAVLKCVASEGVGVSELCRRALSFRQRDALTRNSPAQLREEARALLRGEFEARLGVKVSGIKGLPSFVRLFRQLRST